MKNNITKIVCSLFLVSLLLITSACSTTQKAEQTVDKVFLSIKNGDFEEAQKYLVIENDDNEAEQDDENIDKIKKMFEKLEYTIKSSEEIDSNTVNVLVETKALDIKTVLGNYMQKALQYAFSNAFADPQPTEEETNKKMEEIFIECLTAEDVKTITSEVTVKVVKQGGIWKIISDDAFANAILGGITDLSEAFEGLSGDSEE